MSELVSITLLEYTFKPFTNWNSLDLFRRDIHKAILKIPLTEKTTAAIKSAANELAENILKYATGNSGGSIKIIFEGDSDPYSVTNTSRIIIISTNNADSDIASYLSKEFETLNDSVKATQKYLSRMREVMMNVKNKSQVNQLGLARMAVETNGKFSFTYHSNFLTIIFTIKLRRNKDHLFQSWENLNYEK